MKLSEYKGSEPRHIIVYGAPKTGKTELVGQLSQQFRLWWMDLDGGAKTLMRADAKTNLDNIEYFRIPDTQLFPVAVETLLKVMRGGKRTICHTHGKVDCVDCKSKALPSSEIDVGTFDVKKDILVIDSYTQLMDSVMNWHYKEQLTKDNFDIQSTFHDWKKQGAVSDRFGTTIQNAPWNCVVISHEVLTEQEDNTKKIAPVGGTRNKSSDFARYFDDAVYCEVVGGKYQAHSDAAGKTRVVVGSRTGKKLTGPKGEQLGLIELFK